MTDITIKDLLNAQSKEEVTELVKEASKEWENCPDYDEHVKEHVENLEKFFVELFKEERKREIPSNHIMICTQDTVLTPEILKKLGGEIIEFKKD